MTCLCGVKGTRLNSTSGLKKIQKSVCLVSHFVFVTCVDTAWLSSMMDTCRLSDICGSCHQLATCKTLNGSNNACFCNRGYTGDGTTFCNGEYKDTHPCAAEYVYNITTSLVYSCLGSLDYFRQPFVVCDCPLKHIGHVG